MLERNAPTAQGNTLRLHFLVAFFLLGYSSYSHAEFTDLFVFGDSLSDVGNIDAATFGLQPGGDYFEGRFSNGPVYSELLAEKMGFGPLEPSSSGGNNFAFGGGRTSGTSFFEGGFFIQDLDEQIDDFLGDRQVDPDALHVLLAGANDFALGNEANPIIPVNRIENEIGRLVDAGVKNILSINLPLLGQTPMFATDSEVMNSRSREFNTALGAAIDSILRQNSEVSIFRVDLGELLGQVIAVPSAYGFSNVTDPSIGKNNVPGFLFWDDVHPTTAAHALLAEVAFDLFEPWPIAGDLNFSGQLDVSDADILGYSILTRSTNPRFDLTQDELVGTQDIESLLASAGTVNGDADLNGNVEFPDFVTLARNFGKSGASVFWSSGDFDSSGSVAFRDFLILARNFGKPSPDVALSVPEPRGYEWLLVTALCCLMRRRPRNGFAELRIATEIRTVFPESWVPGVEMRGTSSEPPECNGLGARCSFLASRPQPPRCRFYFRCDPNEMNI